MYNQRPGHPPHRLNRMSHHHHHHHGHSHDHASVDYPQTNYGTGAKWIKHLTQGRLGTFNGGHYADVNLSQVLYHHRVDDSAYIKLQVWSAPGLTKPSFEEAMKQKFKAAKKGDQFGPSCACHDYVATPPARLTASRGECLTGVALKGHVRLV